MGEVACHQEEKEDEAAVVEEIHNVGREAVVAVAVVHDDKEGRVDAAKVNPLDAKVVLGALYVEGKVLKQDIEKGKQLWVEAAEKGSEEAKENLRAQEKAMGK